MTQNDYEKLGGKIKELRTQMHLTQAEVAAALDVTPGYISNVENNRSAMSLRVLIYYAKLMNISLDTLIGTIDSEYKPAALDREILNELSEMDIETKEKVLRTIQLWKES
ncbi:MAG: helix-turn-helix domain-containing protein [Lachnospiraceae bacterium]|nr:helix-turn-helix domain-containing protein [Lachnospiraceae bacterium]